jgi:putative endonuclease
MFIPNPTARFGEDIASNFLKKKGFRIIDRNFRKGYGEIDIVATFQNTLVFIEVKTRATNLYGGAIEAIAYHKLQKLIKTCEFYKMTHKNLPEAMRIDAILIDLENGEVKNIQHIENISGF